MGTRVRACVALLSCAVLSCQYPSDTPRNTTLSARQDRSPVLGTAAITVHDKISEQFIEELRADCVEEREAAAKALKGRAPSSIPYLKNSSQDKDLEVALRCREVLATLSIETAPKDYHDIEKACLQARTMCVKITGEATVLTGTAAERTTFSATVLLAGENRAYVHQSEQPMKGPSHGFALISDGTRLMKVLKNEGHPVVQYLELPRDLNRNLSRILIRDGSPGMMLGLVGGCRGVEDDSDWQTHYSLGELRVVEWDDCARALIYRLDYKREIRRIEGKIWYGASSKNPKKRIRKIECDVGYGKTMIETSEEFTLNADIPNEKFMLPVEMK